MDTLGVSTSIGAAEITAWGAAIVAVVTGIVTSLLNWRKNSDDRADAAYGKQIKLLETRLTETETLVSNCEERHDKAKAEQAELKVSLAVVAERSKQCEQDREQLSKRICVLETIFTKDKE